jgi:hypothetical protein
MKVEHSNAVKNLTDEQLEAMIEHLKISIEAQAGGPIRVIEGTAEPTAVEVTALSVLEPSKRKPNRVTMEADTAVGPSERKPRKVPSPSEPWRYCWRCLVGSNASRCCAITSSVTSVAAASSIAAAKMAAR